MRGGSRTTPAAFIPYGPESTGGRSQRPSGLRHRRVPDGTNQQLRRALRYAQAPAGRGKTHPRKPPASRGSTFFTLAGPGKLQPGSERIRPSARRTREAPPLAVCAPDTSTPQAERKRPAPACLRLRGLTLPVHTGALAAPSRQDRQALWYRPESFPRQYPATGGA